MVSFNFSIPFLIHDREIPHNCQFIENCKQEVNNKKQLVIQIYLDKCEYVMRIH